jgi:hypothetical protein
MRGAIRPFPQYIFMAWCLVKHSRAGNDAALPFTSLVKLGEVKASQPRVKPRAQGIQV